MGSNLHTIADMPEIDQPFEARKTLAPTRQQQKTHPINLFEVWPEAGIIASPCRDCQTTQAYVTTVSEVL